MQPCTADAVRVTAETLIELLDLHFAKEEDILFPMARHVLSPEDMREIAERMDALDIG